MSSTPNLGGRVISSEQKFLLLEYLGSLAFHTRSYVDDILDLEDNEIDVTNVTGRCIRNADGSTEGFEKIRRVIKQAWREGGPQGPGGAFGVMPPRTLSTISRLTKDRHQSFPDPGTQQRGRDDIDVEWTTHIAAKVLLYRIAMGTGTRTQTNTILGPPPRVDGHLLAFEQGRALYLDILRDVRGAELADSRTRPFDDEALRVFTEPHRGDLHRGHPLRSQEALNLANGPTISRGPEVGL